jgi:hypothetical protein
MKAGRLYRPSARCRRLHPAEPMRLSGAGGAVHLDPLLYPWDPPVASGVMDGNEFWPLELSAGLDEALAQASAAPLEARSLVVSIGSNSSADAMRRKFANYHQPVSRSCRWSGGSCTTSPLAAPPT